MDLIVETDLGHDPDDLLALCYLAAAGARIRAIAVVPGHPYQIALGKLFARELGVEIPIGFAKRPSKRVSAVGVHGELLSRYRMSDHEVAHGRGVEVIANVWKRFPGAEFFIIGPASSMGRWIVKDRPDLSASRATMQGGFVPYLLHRPAATLGKFDGRVYVPTFNLDGDRSGAASFIDATFACKRFVGKNICHSIVYDRNTHARIKPHDRASELFKEVMDLYLRNHSSKKLHDPTAAVCHLHPGIGIWIRGKPVAADFGWSFERCPGSTHGLCDLDRKQLWGHILGFN